jgi:hypothetical protein
MAQRTIKNIEKESYPAVGDLIRNFPDLFKKTEMIGIFEGKDICSSFLLNNANCDSIIFYENLSFTDDINVKNQFKTLYKEWEKTVPNLTIHIKDGSEFKGYSDFVFIDTTIPLSVFIKDNFKKLTQSISASPGFGINLKCTLEMSKLILDKTIFPIFVYRDYLFYCYNQDKQLQVINLLINYYTDNKNIYEERINHNTSFLHIKDYNISGYFEDIKKYQ